MRGQQERSGSLFSYVSIEERIPTIHPLRRIRKLADQALHRLNPTFCRLYASEGRPSVPPEQQLLASVVGVLWDPLREAAAGAAPLQPAVPLVCGPQPRRSDLASHHLWPPADCVYTKNRKRLLNEDVMGKFLEKLMGAPEVKPLLSDDHFSVDGTLLQAWASYASLKRVDCQEDPPPPPTGPGEGFGAPKEGKKRAKGDFRVI